MPLPSRVARWHCVCALGGQALYRLGVLLGGGAGSPKPPPSSLFAARLARHIESRMPPSKEKAELAARVGRKLMTRMKRASTASKARESGGGDAADGDKAASEAAHSEAATRAQCHRSR